MDLGKIGYKLYVDDKQYRRTLQGMIGDAGQTANTIGGIFSKLAGYIGLGAVFAASTAQSRAFKRELGNLKSIADDLDMSKIRNEILGVNAALGDAPQLTNALYFAYSAGVRGSEKELVAFTAQITTL